jgi:hypothetical protein
MGPTIDGELRSLGQLLWRYREKLEHVEFLLDVQHLLVANGRDRWLARAADQLRAAAEELADLDHQRSAVLGRVAFGLGRSGGLTLRELAEAAPPPWGDIFADHLSWFTAELARISDAALAARSSVEGGLAGVQQMLQALSGGGGQGYDHAGRRTAIAAAGSLFFDDRA